MTSDELTRDVFAHFGLTAYLAQVLEEAMIVLLKARRLPSRPEVTRREIDELDRWARGRTMGQLKRRLHDELAVDEDASELLAAALTVRNRLMHGYFADRAAKFCVEAGCLEMVAELEGMQDTMQGATREIERIVHPLHVVAGIDDEAIARKTDELLKQVDVGGTDEL